MNMKYYQYTTNDIASTFNQAREMLADFLVKKKMCTEEQAKHLKEEIAFVVVDKGTLGSAIDKALGFTKEDDKPRIKIVELVK